MVYRTPRFVVPKPPLDSRAGGCKGAIRFLLPVRIVFVIAFEAAFSGSRGLHVWLPVQFVLDVMTCRPGVDHARSLLHVVFDFHAFSGAELQFAGVDLVTTRLRY